MPTGTLTVGDGDGIVLANSVLEGPASFVNSTDTRILQCNLPYDGASAVGVSFSGCSSTLLRNNIVLSQSPTIAVSWTGGEAPDSDFNCWYPVAAGEWSPGAVVWNELTQDWSEESAVFVLDEPHSLLVNPELQTDRVHLQDPSSSPLAVGGEPFAGSTPTGDPAQPDTLCKEAAAHDGDGFQRPPATRSIGCASDRREVRVEINATGQVAAIGYASQTVTVQYDALGRVATTGFLEDGAPRSEAATTHQYDFYDRRVGRTVGDRACRMVPWGADTLAELVDEDGDGSVDRTRVYWLLPGIDRRLGFVDLDANGEVIGLYYYLTDQVGTVLQLVGSDGLVASEYDHDAFGQRRWARESEEVENRYTYQGREYLPEAWACDYRMRLYFPLLDSFSGTDLDLRIEGEGVGSYLFCGNDPLRVTDPMGLDHIEMQATWQSRSVDSGLVVWVTDAGARMPIGRFKGNSRRGVYEKVLFPEYGGGTFGLGGRIGEAARAVSLRTTGPVLREQIASALGLLHYDPGEGCPTEFYRKMGNRANGVAKAAGGTLETAVGVGALPLSAGGSSVIAVHGVDVGATGFKQIWTGEVERTMTSQYVQTVAEFAGQHPEDAAHTGEMFDISASIVLPGVGAYTTTRYAEVAERAIIEREALRPLRTPAIPGDEGFIGPHQRGWTLSSDGMGAHMVSRASVRGRPMLEVFDRTGTPRFYPTGTPENAGAAHCRMHRAMLEAGMGQSRGSAVTDDDLIPMYRQAYSDPALTGIRGNLRTPNGDFVLGTDLTPREAFDLLIQWGIPR